MNEIPVSMFEGMAVVLLVLIIYTLTKKTLLTSMFSVILSYVMAQSILNGNVVETIIINNEIQCLSIQSLPIHYLLLGIGVIMTILSFYILLMLLNARIEGIGENSERETAE